MDRSAIEQGIYEAAIVPERWPAVLADLTQASGARGGVLFSLSDVGSTWIADPGLHAAREIANIPVLGLCESAMHIACMMGANFSFVTINEKFTPRVVENVDRYGLRSRFVGASRMRIERLTDLGSGFAPGPIQDEIVSQFNAAARKNTDNGAEVVIAAGGVVMALLAHAGIHATEDGVPILNGITNLVKLGEMGGPQ